MSLLLLFPAVVVFMICALWTVRAIRVQYAFHNPLVVPMIFFILGYPVRYVLTIANPDLFSQSELGLPSTPSVEVLFLALLFASAFVAMIGFGLRVVLPMRERTLPVVTLQSLRFTSHDQLLVHFIFMVYAVAFGYLSVVYGITGLYEDFEQLKKSAAEVLLGEIANLKWFVLTLCLVSYFRSRSRIFLIEALLILASLLYTSLTTTSKGIVLNVVIILLLMFGMLGRKPPYGHAALLLGVGILFGFVSYQIRNIAYFEVRDAAAPFALLTIYGHALSLDSIAPIIESNVIDLVNRITYYGDALVLMINGAVRDTSDLYVLGSLVEFGNLIPTMIWEDRPHMSFNHYVTGAIWGMHGILSETPVGRIGEAFYIGYWFGFLWGFVYAFMFSMFCLLWHRVRKNLWGVAIWAGLIMAWVVPDAYLTYGLKQVLVIGCVGYVLYVLSKVRLPASIRAPWPHHRQYL